MAKQKKIDQPINNFVAKYAREFNKSHIFCDRTKYKRKEKYSTHPEKGDYLITND